MALPTVTTLRSNPFRTDGTSRTTVTRSPSLDGVGRPAAVGVEHLTRDVRRRVREQERGDGADLARFADATERHAAT